MRSVGLRRLSPRDGSTRGLRARLVRNGWSVTFAPCKVIDNFLSLCCSAGVMVATRAIASAHLKGGITLKKGAIRTSKNRHFRRKSSLAQGSKSLALIALGSVVVLLSACGQGSTTTASSVSTSKSSPSSTPTPTPSKVAGTSCTTEKATQVGAGDTYVCGMDQSGKLVWLDSATARKLSDQRAAEAAAKAAADKAAADKAAADKAAADKVAADKAAADKAAAEQAAAAQAAAAKAAADKAAAAVVPKAQAPAPQAQNGCDPNYSGCVPIASDVDCAGGKGNGPAYVRGPVTVIGSDIYKLDSDGDGIGCEK